MRKLGLLLIPILFLATAWPSFAQGLSGIDDPVEGKFTSLGSVLEQALPLIFGLVAFLAVVFFAIGAVRYIASRGDPKAADAARSTMTGAVIGLVIVLGTAAVSSVLSATLGLGLFGSDLNNPGVQNGSFDLSCAFRLSRSGECVGLVFGDFGQLVTMVLLLITSVGALIFFFMLLWGGTRYMLSRGDEKAAAEARSALSNAVVGFLLLISAYLIIRLLATTLFGFEDF
ncbi:MAG TPA: hypothetical protein VIH52_00765 [Candidatus Nanoarchaeia archaeon]